MPISRSTQPSDLRFCDSDIAILGHNQHSPRWLVPNWCSVGSCGGWWPGSAGWARVGRVGVGWLVVSGAGWGFGGVSRGSILLVWSAVRACRGARCWRLRRAG